MVVLPYSRTERFDQSGVLATALAFGKPTVLSDIGGFGEVAATGAGGSFAPGDVEALARGAGRAVGRSGRALVAWLRPQLAAASGPYSWDAAAAKTAALYRELINARR